MPIRPVARPARPRRRPRKPNPEARAKLLRAAAELIGEQGFPALRVEDVASRAGLSVGTFYLYFEGKAGLFTELVIEMTGVLRERLRAAYAGEGSLVERLVRGLDAYLDFVGSNATGFLYFRDAGSVHTTVGSLNSWAFARHAEDLVPVLTEGMERSELHRYPPELLAQALLGQMQHVAGFWLENRDRVTREEVRRLLVEMATRALEP